MSDDRKEVFFDDERTIKGLEFWKSLSDKGYQAPGTRGATLASGGAQLRMHGHDIPVRAEVVQLTSASAHADSNQLMAWLQAMPSAPHRVFVTHGDPEASDRLRYRIEHELRWRALVPEHGSMWSV